MAMVRRCRSRLWASEWAGSQCASCSGGGPSLETPPPSPGCVRVARSAPVMMSSRTSHRGEIRAREVMGHGEREISHAPAHGQPSRRRVKQATPRLERLQVPDPEHVAQLHMEDEAPRLSPPRGVQWLVRELKLGTEG